MTDAIGLLRPWIRKLYGDRVANPSQQLEAFRSIISGDLPTDYAEKLLYFGRAVSLVRDTTVRAIGKAPPRAPGQFTCMSDDPLITTLYGLQTDPQSVFEAWDAFQTRMPPGLVPIGEQGMGDQICIDVSKAGNGRIFSWGHEEDPGSSDAQGRPGWANTFLLATSFTDLLHRLRKDDPLPDDAPIGRICSVRPSSLPPS